MLLLASYKPVYVYIANPCKEISSVNNWTIAIQTWDCKMADTFSVVFCVAWNLWYFDIGTQPNKLFFFCFPKFDSQLEYLIINICVQCMSTLFT